MDKQNNQYPVLGILGGLGPMSGIYFCEMLTAHTKAECDREHINFILSSRADTPDRSSYITGRSSLDPSPIMAREAQRLVAAGADILAIPCNTAHYFYKSICDAVNVPVINIIEETARFCSHLGIKKIGVLATEGTVLSGAYRDICDSFGIAVVYPAEQEQSLITHIIFDCIKSGRSPDPADFFGVCNSLRESGCERIILGCTELSLLKKQFALTGEFVDSLELLTLRAIAVCGKTPVGFDTPLMNFYGSAEKGN